MISMELDGRTIYAVSEGRPGTCGGCIARKDDLLCARVSKEGCRDVIWVEYMDYVVHRMKGIA